ncbi:Oidioi.mRNA.OKI2018_I69.chr2.g7615.t1.cds [Oikopleura dioica]|uniref:Oidioi.mRNA.OKI2018_I69.chr2.g7615.t1.cds n=1 Tax=Oikopleura dioica TaxID=34765 RepID=A0ABN7T6Q7_OIKDI|nr:Oidioi.mRNA.OKI2018_I69.chr2.g7615.t1.cds [Oikopleura dioica]
MMNFQPSQSEFDSIKAQFLQDYKTKIQNPEDLSEDLKMSFLKSTNFPLIERIKALESVTLEELIEFVKSYRNDYFLSFQIQGNYYIKEARKIFHRVMEQFTGQKPVFQIIRSFLKNFGSKNQNIEPHRLTRRFSKILQVPDKPSVIITKNVNPTDVNTSYNIHWHVGHVTIKECIKNQLLVTILEEPCFDILRTKKCLGYSVDIQLEIISGMVGIGISIVSQQDKFSVKEIHGHVLDFIKEMEEFVNNLSDEKFNEHREGLLYAKHSSDEDFEDWNAEIAKGEYRFDRVDFEVSYLKQITKEEIAGVFKTSITENKKIVLVVVEGNESNRTSSGQELSLEHVPAEDFFEEFEQIENIEEARARFGFFDPTYININEDKAYYDDKLLEHACPMEIRRSTQTLRNRVPDIIGIGFAKCGTGALAFLDCHPSATFRTNEPRFFDKESVLDDIINANKTGNVAALDRHRKIYASRLPRAADDELLIEKSPQYAGGKDYIRKKRALAMKIINPNVKLVAIVCDPVKRAYSQLRLKRFFGKPTTYALFQAILHFTKTLDRLYENGHESGFASYAPYLAPYLERGRLFRPENVYVGDGENMISNPNYEWGKLMDFLRIEKDYFKFFVPEEKGFPCLEMPIRHCLNAAKGTSRKTPVREVYPAQTAKWERTFTRSIKNMIIELNICESINSHCCSLLADESNSYSWAHDYVC